MAHSKEPKKRKPRQTPCISAEHLSGREAGGGVGAVIGGPNVSCRFVEVFCGPQMESLASFLWLNEAASLQQLCKALWHSATDPVSLAGAAILRPSLTYKQLDRMGQLRVLRIDDHHTKPKIRSYAGRFGPFVESLEAENCEAAIESWPALRQLTVHGSPPSIFPSRYESEYQAMAFVGMPVLSCVRINGLSLRQWAALTSALCRSPCCPRLRVVELRVDRDSDHDIEWGPWHKQLRRALTEGRLANLESYSMVLPDGMSAVNATAVMSQGFTKINLPHLRKLEINTYVRLSAVQWRTIWDQVDGSILQALEVHSSAGLNQMLSDHPFPGLEVLWGKNLGSELPVLANAMIKGHLPGLKELIIGGATLNEPSASVFAEALTTHCSSLTSLSITYDRADEDVVRHLLALATDPQGALCELSLKMDRSPGDHTPTFTSPLLSEIQFRRIKKLDLSGFGISSAVLKSWAEQRRAYDGGVPLEHLAINVDDDGASFEA